MNKVTACALVLFAAVAFGQTKPVRREAGQPFITWFSPQDYSASSQIWSFAQDGRGILYAGTAGGVIEHDGLTWRKVATPHNAVTRSMSIGPGGRIYVGEVGDFGYLEPDANGQTRYVSLLPFVPEAERDFQDVNNVVNAPEGIYFATRERLFLFAPDGAKWRVTSWKPEVGFGRTRLLFGSLYIAESAKGLRRLQEGRMEGVPLPGLAHTLVDSVTLLQPLNEKTQQALVGTRGGRLFVLDAASGAFQPFKTEAESLLKEQGLSSSVLLEGGRTVVIGTARGGLLILEADGRIRRYLDRLAGIPSDGAINMMVDAAGTLWVGLQNGIAKVEVASPLSEFIAVGGSTAVNDIIRHQGDLYTATLKGVAHLDGTSGTFRTVPGSEKIQVFGLYSRGNTLFAAGGREGIFTLTSAGFQSLFAVNNEQNAFAIAASRQDPDRAWVGVQGGLASMRLGPGAKWIDEGIVVPLPRVRSMVEAEPGVLWLGTQNRGAIRVLVEPGPTKESIPTIKKVDRFDKSNGLPCDGGISVHKAGSHVVFACRDGVREFDPSSSRFVESKALGSVPTGGYAEEYTVVSDKRGNLWANFGVVPVYLAIQPDGSYKADLMRMQRVGTGRVVWLHLDDDDVLWMGGIDRIFRYDPAAEAIEARPFSVLLRRVTAGEATKSVLYGGGGGPAAAKQARIDYQTNALRFEYAAASFDDPRNNQFQTRLEGFDDDWSAWTTESRRDYTNLSPGSYRFRVKARSALMQESAQEAEYRFEILPPWYRTWWAYGFYALLLGGLVYGSDRLMRRQLVARERAKAEARMVQSELERKRNVELLSEIGKQITSSLDIDTIFGKLYENVSQLMDASIFGVGIYNAADQVIEYRLALENGKRYQPYKRDTRDKDQFPVWCVDHRKPVFVNDLETQYSKYISKFQQVGKKLEDGSDAQTPQSLIYLPLIVKDRVRGIITVQSFKKYAYSEYQLNLLENLAAYTAIALDNADAYESLKSAQDQLVVQEKLASLGALTAGIAHEIKNPLNFVNNFADLSVELVGELRVEVNKLEAGETPDIDNMKDLLSDLSGNAKKINEHGRRADGIVKSMLMHSRGHAGERQPTDINALLDEYTNLAYHGMRAQDSTFNVTIQRDFDPAVGKIDAIQQDLSRVFLNLLNNACYAADHRAKSQGSAGFKPTLRVRTVNLDDDRVEIRIHDNGMGIPADIREKIFHPFFTTKPTGQGTGLGLSISHDIVVQQHGGQLEVESQSGEYTEFVVRLPRRWGKN